MPFKKGSLVCEYCGKVYKNGATLDDFAKENTEKQMNYIDDHFIIVIQMMQFFKSKCTTPYWTILGPNLLYCGQQVIAAKDVTNFIQGLYNDPASHVNGCNRLYAKIQELNYGITNKQVMDFLKSQKLYQLHNQVSKDKVVKHRH